MLFSNSNYYAEFPEYSLLIEYTMEIKESVFIFLLGPGISCGSFDAPKDTKAGKLLVKHGIIQDIELTRYSSRNSADWIP